MGLPGPRACLVKIRAAQVTNLERSVGRPGVLTSLDRRPVVALVLAAVTTIAAVKLVGAPTADPDVWWVAAVGRDAPLFGPAPATNFYSFTDSATPWIFHERLFGTLYAWGLAHVG